MSKAAKSYSLESTVIDALDSLAAKEGRKPGDMVARLLQSYLNRDSYPDLPPDEAEKKAHELETMARLYRKQAIVDREQAVKDAAESKAEMEKLNSAKIVTISKSKPQGAIISQDGIVTNSEVV